MRELALFLGAKIVSDKTLNPLITKWSSPNFKPLNDRFLSGHELKFDSDWNWIAAVAQKIYSVGKTSDEKHWHTFHTQSVDISEAILKNDIKKALNDCIEMVKYIKIHKIKVV